MSFVLVKQCTPSSRGGLALVGGRLERGTAILCRLPSFETRAIEIGCADFDGRRKAWQQA